MASLARNWDSLAQDTHAPWDAEGAIIGWLTDHEKWTSSCSQSPEPVNDADLEQQAATIFNGFEEAVLVRQLEDQVSTLAAQLNGAIEIFRLAIPQAEVGDLSQAWPGYLLSLLINGPLAADQAVTAMSLWGTLKAAVPNLTPPHAAAFDDGTFSMTWDKGSHHFEVELHAGGLFDWFYLDRATDEFFGEDGLQIGYISRQMIDLLLEVSS
jgi:hypothetical protein